MHILTHEEGEVRYLHYGLFENDHEPLLTAQERSTELLLSRLPPPPARLLEVGIGLATTLSRLTALHYDVDGITPDPHQVTMARERYGDTVRVHCEPFETFESPSPIDAIVFQESSQYIDSEVLFARADRLTSQVLVLDEFALQPLEEEGALHSRDRFLAAAARRGFSVEEELDLSARAAPTMSYFTDRIPAYRERLIADLGIHSQQVDDLITSGARYRKRYADGIYGYRLFSLRKENPCSGPSSPSLSP